MSNRDESVRLLSDDDLEIASEQHAEDTPEDLIVFDGDAERPIAARTARPNDRNTFSNRLVISVLFIVLFGIGAALGYWIGSPATQAFSSNINIADIQRCTIRNLHRDPSFLEDADFIKPEEFIQRRNRLAVALHEDGIDAFVLEPGYTFQYYGNVSQQDWEPWEPEERPFLMVVRPDVHDDGSVTARTTFLCPHFEESRVRQLGIPSDSDLEIVTWEEHWNPYSTLLGKAFNGQRGLTIMTDEELRDYIVRGLDSVGFKTVGLTAGVDAVRQQKSPTELSLLRAVNTGTVEAVRSMRPCLVPGLSEDQVISILDNALLTIPGFSLFFNIVLFDENAALPHGGKATGGKRLEHSTVVLIDVGAHYRGYSSDVTRTFVIDPPNGRTRKDVEDQDPQFALKNHVFNTVLAAQDASILQFRPGQTAASVDLAAREVIGKQGWGKYFTHRVGHGIGIKAHESPYLNKGNTDVVLRENMTFTGEPGIYMTSKFGVRVEDVFAVTRQGEEVRCLSGSRAKSLWEP